MLATLDLTGKISKEEYRAAREQLDVRLSDLQRKVRAAGRPVVIVFEGWEAAGVGTAIGRVLGAMDPRGYKVHNFVRQAPEAFLRPPLWQFWITLPPAGEMAVYDGSWYRWALELKRAEREDAFRRIRIFERQIADDGAIVIKFWLHISEKEQGRRFRKMEANPAQAWMVSKQDWRRHEQYGKRLHLADDMMEATSLPHAPWVPVASQQLRYAAHRIATTLADRLEQALAEPLPAAQPPARPRGKRYKQSPLDALDMTLQVDPETYNRELGRLQKRLLELEHQIYVPRIPVVIAYEGWDAAGKGGNIKRLVAALDHRGFEVIPVGAPQGEERQRHYLWRFWRNLPKGGHITIFDRTWYGRVLVERVEGFATEAQGNRAYQEIVEFEEELLAHGMVLVKFWINITKDEQLRRFRQRESLPHKQWKITPEDWRNRRNWNKYHDAVSEMIVRTSTPAAPWTIIEGNQKYHARLKALATVCDAIQARLDLLK